ncbi:MAG: hypothetical protein HY718_13970 [Planctomycetes bacterium]|nr:hypothetical protein [Planctomycetota bacterium]
MTGGRRIIGIAAMVALAGGAAILVYGLSGSIRTKNVSDEEWIARLDSTDPDEQVEAIDALAGLTAVDESGWCNFDSVSGRHLREPSGHGYGNLGYADGHAGKFQTPRRPPADLPDDKVLVANWMCFRTTGGKWISGRSWGGRMYRFFDSAPPASSVGLQH